MPFRHTRGCAKRFGCWSINIALIIFFFICPYLFFFLLLLRLLHLLLHLRRLHLGRTRHSEEDRLSLTGAEPLKSCWRRPCLIERRRKQALLGAKCVQAHNASKRPYNDPMATEDERACFETKYVRSKIVSCIHLLGSNVCEAHMWITRYCSLLLVTRDTGIPYAGFTNQCYAKISVTIQMSSERTVFIDGDDKPDQPKDKWCLFFNRGESFSQLPVLLFTLYKRGKRHVSFLPLILLNRTNWATRKTGLCYSVLLKKFLDSHAAPKHFLFVCLFFVPLIFEWPWQQGSIKVFKMS